jgi:hypothetical protein
MLPANHSFQCGEKLILLQIGLYSYVEEKHVPLKRKPCILETAASSPLFLCENRDTF